MMLIKFRISNLILLIILLLLLLLLLQRRGRDGRRHGAAAVEGGAAAAAAGIVRTPRVVRRLDDRGFRVVGFAFGQFVVVEQRAMTVIVTDDRIHGVVDKALGNGIWERNIFMRRILTKTEITWS